jgi:hypothetical protein
MGEIVLMQSSVGIPSVYLCVYPNSAISPCSFIINLWTVLLLWPYSTHFRWLLDISGSALDCKLHFWGHPGYGVLWRLWISPKGKRKMRFVSGGVSSEAGSDVECTCIRSGYTVTREMTGKSLLRVEVAQSVGWGVQAMEVAQFPVSSLWRLWCKI